MFTDKCHVSLTQGELIANEKGIERTAITSKADFDVASDKECTTDFAKTKKSEFKCANMEKYAAEELIQ
jgi:tellurite resistance protein